MKEGWTYKKLGEVCEIFGRIGFRGYTKADLVDSPDNGAITLSPSNIVNGEMNYSKCSYITWAKYEESPEIMIYPGDILLVKTASVGKTALVKNLPHKATINPQFVVFKNIKTSNEYLSYYMKSEKAQGYIWSIAKGAAAQTVSQKNLAEMQIPVPSLSEQQQIVSYLDSSFAHIDELKANAEKQLNDAKALFQKALEKAMEPKEGWKEKTIGDIAIDMYRGNGIKRDQITKEGVPCIRYGEIYTTYNIAFDECVSHTQESYISSPKYFEHGDLLFAITGESVEDIGKTIAYLGNDKCLCGGDIICMKHKQNPKFLAYALSTPEAIRQKGIGKTKLKVVHTNAPALKSIKIPIPPLSEQQAIVSRLDNLSANIKALEENLEKTISECNALKQAILRDIFE